jgi:multidrug resistance efflux pump
MPRKLIPIVVVVVVVMAAFAAWLLSGGRTDRPFTGFVEGEERLLRSEVAARVVEIPFEEGDSVPAGAVVARLDTTEIDARIASQRRELEVTDADILVQGERVKLIEATWPPDVRARAADVDQAEAAARNAEQTFARERDLVRTGASTAQDLDDARARRDQAQAVLARTRDLLTRTKGEEASIALAQRQLDSLRSKRDLLESKLAELEVVRGKHEIRAPAVATVVQTQLLWPGELAQPGTPVVAVLDPLDKYVQIYVPVADVMRVRVGRRVEIELDGRPGERIPGEISFVADQANFTPEKIETRGDRLGQVYRAKVRILEGAERLQPGAEGNVYLSAEGAQA